MKKIILILAIVFIVGCATKTKIQLDPYITMNQNGVTNLKFYITDIKDNRVDKIISKIIDKNSEIITTYNIDTNLISWYKDAFQQELKTINALSSNGISLTIVIKKIELIYKKGLPKKDNLKANVKLQLIAKYNNITDTINVSVSQSDFKTVILDASGFDKILNEVLKNSVSKSIAILIDKLKSNK